MPKREDEYWAGKKEPKGRGLCPRCGSSKISYNKKFQSWRCNKCEHSFPIPSYGPGGDFGKEARWLGKTTKVESPFDPKHVDYYKGKYRGRRRKGGGFPIKKAFLLLLVTTLIGGTASAFAGVEPLATYKDTLIEWVKEVTKDSDYAEIFNEYRVSQGLSPLTFNEELSAIAQIRVKEIQSDFSHKGIEKYNLGENIAKGIGSNSQALTVWKNSPLHNANMLRSSYSFTGYCREGGYAVQVFQ